MSMQASRRRLLGWLLLLAVFPAVSYLTGYAWLRVTHQLQYCSGFEPAFIAADCSGSRGAALTVNISEVIYSPAIRAEECIRGSSSPYCREPL